jgi:hypothetical protein
VAPRQAPKQIQGFFEMILDSSRLGYCIMAALLTRKCPLSAKVDIYHRLTD